jgi:hypothetical protein
MQMAQVIFSGIVQIETVNEIIPFELAYRTIDGKVSNEPDHFDSMIIGRFCPQQPIEEGMCYISLGIR